MHQLAELGFVRLLAIQQQRQRDVFLYIQHRQTFSQKKTINGYKETGQYLTYQGTSFEVLCLEDNFNIELFKEPMSTLHVKNFNPRFFTQAGSEER